MSRKKNLSPTASLAACLDFAARVLTSTATVQDICTKRMLAPMVVEAHRCGQQVMKCDSNDAPADARSILLLLQGDQNAKLCQDSPIVNLRVADLRWDFEGSVADTLEMELGDLQERAAANPTDTCVIFSASSLSLIGSAGQAVIWFPREIHASKKHQFLLYVCPGRVKVVKSRGDLIKKLYDELPMLRESDATYNVWAVVVGSSGGNQQEGSPKNVKLTPTSSVGGNKRSIERFKDHPESPATTTTETYEESHRLLKLTKSRAEISNQDATESVENTLVTTPDTTHNGLVDQGDLPPLSPRFTVDNDAINVKHLTAASIFSFGAMVPADLPTGVSCDEGENAEEIDDTQNAVGEDNCHADNQRQDSWPRRAVVSASLAGLSIPNGNVAVGMERGLGLSVRLKGDFAWQSCDGKVLRRSVRPLKANTPVEREFLKPNYDAVSGDIRDAADVHDMHENGMHEENNGINEIDHTAELQEDITEVVESDNFLTERRNKEHLSCQGVHDPTLPRMDTTSSLSIFMFEHDSRVNHIVSRFQSSAALSTPVKPSVALASSMTASSHLDIVVDPQSDNNSVLEPSLDSPTEGDDDLPEHTADDVKPLEDPDLEVESSTILPVLNQKNAPVNYKDKLGARVWWELEYTARRLEREEIMERQQYARRRPVGNPVNESYGSGIKTFTRMNEPLRRAPTGWSKKIGLVQHSVAPTISKEYERTNQQEHLRKCVTSRAPKPREEQLIVDEVRSLRATRHSLLPQSSHCSSPIHCEATVSPCESNSPSDTSNENGSIECLYSRSEITESKKEVESFRLSGGESISTCENVSAELSVAAKEDQDLKITIADDALGNRDEHSQASTTKLHEKLSQSPPQRDKSLKRTTSLAAVDNGSVKTSLVSFREPQTRQTNNQDDDEDDTLSLRMWGNTRTVRRTSYERDHNAGSQTPSRAEELLSSTETVPGLPFTVRGRVPIRVRQPSSRVIPATGDLQKTTSSCGSVDNAHLPNDSPRADTRTSRNEIKSQNCVESSRLPRPSTRGPIESAIPTPPPVATFIALGEDNSTKYAASSDSRQDRLNELRQRKLRKLQQTRDVSIQQQKEKQMQRQVHRPLSFANSIYSKKASNRQLMHNALEFTLLAGGSMEKERSLALLALAESTCENFIVLLKSAKELKFRALYENHVDRDCATRIFSVLPNHSARAPMKLSSSESISQFFKYSSAKKQFLPVSTRSFTVKTDACALVDQHVLKNKPRTSSSALSRLL